MLGSVSNPTAKVDDDALTAIIQESNKTMLELNAANKAWWQGGAGKPAPQRIFSMTGQFQQVLAKTVELSLKGEQRGGFTNAQKKRIAVGQLLMFGAAGIPLVSVVAPAMFEWMGVEPDESMANTVNQGLTGTIVKEVFAADIDIANRAALFSSTFETVKDIITSKDPMWSKFLAVTGTTGVRVGEALESSSMVLQSQAFARLAELEPLLTHNRASETDMNVPTMIETAADMAVIMTGITSSGRNLLKARMMHNSNKILDRRGRVTIEREDGFTFADKLGVALGFQLTAETRLRQVQQSNREVDMVVNEAADVIIKAYHRYVYTHDMNPKYAQSVKNIQQMVHEALDNEFLIDRVNEQVSRKVFSEPQTLEDRELKKFYERTVAEKLSESVILDTTLGLNRSNIFNKQAIVQPFTDTLEQENK